MKRDKWSVNLRNQLSSLAFDCAYCAKYEKTMTKAEREHISDKLLEVIEYIDEQINI